MEKTVADRIEKEVVLHAPRARVWEALTDVEQLGEWLHIKFAGKVVPGARLSGLVTHPGYEGITIDAFVEQVEPQKKLSWRWHPHAVDREADYSQEPTTLVTFELEEVSDGTRLRVVESGFHKIPIVRRAKAYESNTGGWVEVLQSIQKTMDAVVNR